MRPRGVLVLCCVHLAQLKNDWLFIHYCLPFGIPQRVTKTQKFHKSSHDGLQNFMTPAFLNIGPMIS